MRTHGVLAAIAAALCLVLCMPGFGQCAVTELISRDRIDHTQGNSTSMGANISANGRWVVFTSLADNLVAGSGNTKFQVYVYDRQVGVTELVSAQLDGSEANGDCHDPVISNDGRYVAYSSYATGLIPGVGDGARQQIYLRDRTLDTNTLISSASPGYANNDCEQPSMSGNGLRIAFRSKATNIGTGDGPTVYYQVFMADREYNTLSLISSNASGNRCNGNAFRPQISSDGSVIVFYSEATDFIEGPTTPQIYLASCVSSVEEVISVDATGSPISTLGLGKKASVSSNGSIVAFNTNAADVVAGVGNGVTHQVYVRDRAAGSSTLISVSNIGNPGNGDSTDPSISAGSFHVAFYSAATDLTSDDVDGISRHLYKHDRFRGVTNLVSVDYNGTPRADSIPMNACLSSDGRYVAFHSGISNLLPGIDWGYYQVYCRDTVAAPENISLTPSGGSLASGPFTIEADYRDANGSAGIRRFYLLLNDTLSQSGAALVMYDWYTDKFYLKNDSNTSWGTGYALGSNAVLENSQCKFYVKDTTMAGGAYDLWIGWRLELKAPFSGKNLNGYMYCQDETSLSDGWERKGIYYNVKPQAVSINPADGEFGNDVKITIKSTFRDPNGFADIRKCYTLLCEDFSQANAAFLYYDRVASKVYLKNDENTSWGTGYSPGTDVTLSNSQCEVYVDEVIVVSTGDDVRVEWSLKLKPSMANKNLLSWMYVADVAGLHDGWKKVGTHFTPVPPVCVSVSPSTGKVQTGTPLVFTTRYSDDNGSGDIFQCYFQMGQTGSLANAVCVMYDKAQNKVFLRNDGNTVWSRGYTPGDSIVLENSQCKVYVANTTVSSDSDDLQIEWSIELKPILVPKLLGQRMFCRDKEYLNSGWKLKGYVRAQ